MAGGTSKYGNLRAILVCYHRMAIARHFERACALLCSGCPIIFEGLYPPFSSASSYWPLL